tara:strand:- start:7879 stop:8379 length:501 start_codon:yes stop_codon:yes gene_type:complete
MKIYLTRTRARNLKKKRSIAGTLNYLLKNRPATYHDTSAIRRQCKHNRSRSFSELFWMLKAIHPSVNVKQYSLLLKNELLQNKTGVLLFCPSVQKITIDRNFVYTQSSQVIIPFLIYNYSYHVSKNFYSKGKGEFCMNNVLILMDFTDSEIREIKKEHNIKMPVKG